MKYALSIFLGLILTTLVGVFIAHAQDYTPLAPLPGTFTGATGSETTNLSMYLGGMLKLLIALGAGVSILVAIIGGTQYVAAGIAPSAKQDAKERILNALIGLALVLTSYLILNSINPGLVQFNFSLPPIGTSPAPTTTGGGVHVPEPLPTEPWPSDTTERAALVGVSVNRPTSCSRVGERACTSIANIGSTIISGLNSLKAACGASCVVVITGGTEYWLHGNRSTNMSSNNTAHKPGGNAVDLSTNNAPLNEYLRSGGPVSVAGCASGLKYRVLGALFVDENIPGNPPHWHVCY